MAVSLPDGDWPKLRAILKELQRGSPDIVYKGFFADADALITEHGQPLQGWAYINTTDGYQYVYQFGAWVRLDNPGYSVFTAYHDADLSAKPSNPTGTGTTGGWYWSATEDARWMSHKLARNAAEGDWSEPVPIRGADGAGGAEGEYREFIFKRAASSPTKPDQANGIGGASPNDWHDGPPAGTDRLWMCSCYKAADGSFGDGVTAWDDPIQLDGDSTTAQYSIDGATDWHSTFTAGDEYMRISTDRGATWSDAMKIIGEDGADGEDGVDGSGLSDDVPMYYGLKFSISSGDLTWSAGTIEFGGSSYTVSAPGSPLDNDYIYWDEPDSTPGAAAVLRGTDDLATAIDVSVNGHWLLCQRVDGAAIPVAPQRAVLAGVIIANTLSAIAADLGTITAGTITLSGASGSATTEALARYQFRMTAAGLQGRWRGSGLPAWSDTASGTPGATDYNSGWRYIIDISSNEVKVSFDSYNAGDKISGLGTPVIGGLTVEISQTLIDSHTSAQYGSSWADHVRSDPARLMHWDQRAYFEATDVAVDSTDSGETIYIRPAMWKRAGGPTGTRTLVWSGAVQSTSLVHPTTSTLTFSETPKMGEQGILVDDDDYFELGFQTATDSAGITGIHGTFVAKSDTVQMNPAYKV